MPLCGQFRRLCQGRCPGWEDRYLVRRGFSPYDRLHKEQFEKELHFQCTYIHPDDLPRATEMMNHSKETQMPTTAEGRILTRDGTQKVLTMTFCYVSAENSWDGIESFYSVGIDITKSGKYRSSSTMRWRRPIR